MRADTPGAILFDIDGTLVDSNYVHVNAWQSAFRDVGHPVDAWRIHRRIGMGSSQLLADLLGAAAEELADQAKQRHTEHYRQMFNLVRTFDGASELVRTVAGRGARAVLATSAAPEELELLRSILDVDDVVAAIIGAKDVPAAKPEPDMIHVALNRVGVAPDRAVFLGDTVWDVYASATAGLACAGVLSGGISSAELTEAGAVEVYQDCRALLRELDASPLASAWT